MVATKSLSNIGSASSMFWSMVIASTLPFDDVPTSVLPLLTVISELNAARSRTRRWAAGARFVTRSFATDGLKPSNPARSWYCPGVTRSKRKVPAPSVTVVCATVPVGATRSTVAPGSTEPV